MNGNESLWLGPLSGEHPSSFSMVHASAMDPWVEADWLERFRRLVTGHTAIVITHRLTTAMIADEIHLMEGGRIAESGSHRELISRTGRYAAWWAAQENRSST